MDGNFSNVAGTPWSHSPSCWVFPAKAITRCARKIFVVKASVVRPGPCGDTTGHGSGPARIGWPWLTILIDYYSRLVVGFCLGFERPVSAFRRERHALVNKSRRFRFNPLPPIPSSRGQHLMLVECVEVPFASDLALHVGNALAAKRLRRGENAHNRSISGARVG